MEYATGVNEFDLSENSFIISQNYPNPFKEKTEVDLYLPGRENIRITVRNILGSELTNYENTLNQGNHSFTFYPGNEKYYLLIVTGKQASKTIKMLNSGSNTTSGRKCKIVYNKYDGNEIGFKTLKAINGFGFNIGDKLKYTCYSDIGERTIIDTPASSKTYTFQFAIGVPCPGTPTVTYKGQVYNTVLISSQCWLKENLNVGTMINGSQNQQNNDTIEKYCYDNYPAYCNTYGGLYQWDEMMQYTTSKGAQGICPPDWHLPTDEEWKILEGNIDSQYPVGDPEWDTTGWRGLNAGLRLKSESGWYNDFGNGNNESGFTALPGGYRKSDGLFYLFTYIGTWWSASESSGLAAWTRSMYYNSIKVNRYNGDLKTYAHSVRCLKN